MRLAAKEQSKDYLTALTAELDVTTVTVTTIQMFQLDVQVIE